MNVLIIEEQRSAIEEMTKIIEREFPRKYPKSILYVDLCNSVNDASFFMKNVFYDVIIMRNEYYDQAVSMIKTPNVILYSDNKDDALGAWNTNACYFMVSPFTEEQFEYATEKIIYPIPNLKDDKIEIQCFGAFEIRYRGQPVQFKRKKSIEMLAILVDNLGADTSNERLRAYLWDFSEDHVGKKAYVRQLARDIRKTFDTIGVENVLINTSGGYMLNKSMIECDYFKYIERPARKQPDVYMAQYDWAILSK